VRLANLMKNFGSSDECGLREVVAVEQRSSVHENVILADEKPHTLKKRKSRGRKPGAAYGSID
jgi:hypothetical protein